MLRVVESEIKTLIFWFERITTSVKSLFLFSKKERTSCGIVEYYGSLL